MTAAHRDSGFWFRTMIIFMVSFALCQAAVAAPPESKSPEFISKTIEAASLDWANNMKDAVLQLFFLLAAIDAAWMAIRLGIQTATLEQWVSEIIKKIFFWGFGIFILQNGADFAQRIIFSFTELAGIAAGNYQEMNATSIWELGYETAEQLAQESSFWDGIKMSYFIGIAVFAILIICGYISAVLILAYAEAFIVIGAGTVVLGFLGSEWTKEIGRKYLNFAILTGVKLFATLLIGQLGMTLISGWIRDIQGDDLAQIGAGLGAITVFALLISKIPNTLVGMMSGGGIAGGEGIVAGAIKTAAIAGTTAATGGAAAVGQASRLAAQQAALGGKSGLGKVSGIASGTVKNLSMSFADEMKGSFSARDRELDGHKATGSRMALRMKREGADLAANSGGNSIGAPGKDGGDNGGAAGQGGNPRGGSGGGGQGGLPRNGPGQGGGSNRGGANRQDGSDNRNGPSNDSGGGFGDTDSSGGSGVSPSNFDGPGGGAAGSENFGESGGAFDGGDSFGNSDGGLGGQDSFGSSEGGFLNAGGENSDSTGDNSPMSLDDGASIGNALVGNIESDSRNQPNPMASDLGNQELPRTDSPTQSGESGSAIGSNVPVTSGAPVGSASVGSLQGNSQNQINPIASEVSHSSAAGQKSGASASAPISSSTSGAPVGNAPVGSLQANSQNQLNPVSSDVSNPSMSNSPGVPQIDNMGNPGQVQPSTLDQTGDNMAGPLTPGSQTAPSAAPISNVGNSGQIQQTPFDQTGDNMVRSAAAAAPIGNAPVGSLRANTRNQLNPMASDVSHRRNTSVIDSLINQRHARLEAAGSNNLN